MFSNAYWYVRMGKRKRWWWLMAVGGIGTKFLIFAEPHQPNIDVICRRVYELYADFVMKNPFYQIEMPIRCESFDRHIAAYIKPKQ